MARLFFRTLSNLRTLGADIHPMHFLEMADAIETGIASWPHFSLGDICESLGLLWMLAGTSMGPLSVCAGALLMLSFVNSSDLHRRTPCRFNRWRQPGIFDHLVASRPRHGDFFFFEFIFSICRNRNHLRMDITKPETSDLPTICGTFRKYRNTKTVIRVELTPAADIRTACKNRPDK